MTNNITDEQIKEILGAYLSRKISDEQLLTLKEWTEDSPGNMKLLELLEKSEGHLADLGKLYSYDQNRVRDYIDGIRRKGSRRRKLVNSLKYCAAAAVLLVAGWGASLWMDSARQARTAEFISHAEPGNRGAFLTLSNGERIALAGDTTHHITEQDGTFITIGNEQVIYDTDPSQAVPVLNTIEVMRGKEYSLILSDGTRVWLNSGSSITYPSRFSGPTREVKVTGEVYFEVSHDPARQFIASTGDMSVKVYGTSFNIMAYMDEPSLRTTLVEGRVEVVYGESNVMLSPGGQASLDRESGRMTVREVDAGAVVSWTKGTFSFFNDDLPSICRKLSRWYSIDIEGEGSLRFSGEIEKYESLADLLEILKLTNEIEVKLTNEKLTIVASGRNGR